MTGFELLTLTVALAIASLLLILVLACVWWFDRYDREPVHLVIGTFLWGAVLAPAASIVVLDLVLDHLGSAALANWLPIIGPVAAGPVVEEATKALGVLFVALLFREFDNPTDGLVYGTSVGLGFATTETVVYAVASAAAAPSQPHATLTLIVGRTLFTAGIHALCTATFGGILGLAALRRRRWTATALALGGLAAATILHAGWNSALTFFWSTEVGGLPPAWLAVVPVLYLAYVAVFAAFLHTEHRILQTELSEEVKFALVPAWVADVIPFYRRRVRGDWWPDRRERIVISRLLTRLAFRKHAVRHLPRSEADIASLEVVRLRQRARTILGDAQTDEEP